MSGTYGKGRSFDELAEIAQARLKRIRELEAALADAEKRISVLYWEAVEARAALAAGGSSERSD